MPSSARYTPSSASAVRAVVALAAERVRHLSDPAAVEAARASPLGVARLDWGQNWLPGRHLDLINERLLALSRREIRRLMVFLPPRYAKSTLCSHYFPAWYLGTHPHHHVIVASYGAEKAADYGRAARDTMTARAERVFGVRIRGDSDAAHRWQLEGHRGGLYTAGIRGPITGRGADLLIIDDPVKDEQEAWSAVIQAGNASWWEAVASTRLEPGAVVVLIMTRWHPNDLAGYLLAKGSGQQWEVISLPAMAEDENDQLGRKRNEILWPERFGDEEVISRRDEMQATELGRYYWQSMYQQRPDLPEGLLYFDRAACEAGLSRETQEPLSRLDTRPSPDAPADGYALIWERPVAGVRYYIGADTADGKGEALGSWGATGGPDRNCAVIYRWPDQIQVAEIYGRQEEHAYARLLDEWGRAYNHALLAVERNRRAVLVALREMNYPNLYWTMRPEDMHLVGVANPARAVQYGWETTAKTRPLMLEELREAVRTGTAHMRSRESWEECLSFVQDDPPAAMPGQHDDRVIAHAIARQAAKRMGLMTNGHGPRSLTGFFRT